MSDPEHESQKRTQNSFLGELKGRQVLVVFLDGKAAPGVLTGFDQYTLFLQREDGKEVAVFKHGVKYLHAA